MSLCTGSGSLPKHVYCQVDSRFVRTGADVGSQKSEPCVWFGLQSYPGRAWGCHVMLECGAVVRSLPLHALRWKCGGEAREGFAWNARDAQEWDCYGLQFSLHEYSYLSGLEARVKLRRGGILRGEYMFTAVPVNDAYTAEPAQSKEFMFLMMENGRFAAMPTNRVLFIDASFTSGDLSWPADIKLQEECWSAE